MKYLCVFMAFVLGSICTQAWAEKRVALVIGNSAYQHTVQLANPKNDPSDMAAKLQSLGFEVVSDKDLDLAGMRRTVRDFVGKLDGADMALFFYAGHGLQVNGNNYMVPVDAQLSGYNDLDFEALPMDLILRRWSAAPRSTSSFSMPAGTIRSPRSFPARWGRAPVPSVGSGQTWQRRRFADRIRNATGKRCDGRGRAEFAVHDRTARAPRHAGAGHHARPHRRAPRCAGCDGGQASPVGKLLAHRRGRLKPRRDGADLGGVCSHAARGGAGQFGRTAYWASTKDSTDRSFFEAYLQQFPTGAFAALARLKIDAIDKRVEAERQAAAKQVAQPPEAKRAATAADDAKTTDIASLEQADPLAQPPAGITDPGELTLATQTELARIGCLAGQADGKWGSGSRKALQDYADRQGLKLGSLEPTGGLLERLKAVGDRVCPLVCGSGTEAKDGRCVPQANRLSAFDGTWRLVRRATTNCGEWRELSTHVSISDGIVSSDSGFVGRISSSGAVSIRQTFVHKGKTGGNNLTGMIKGDKGTGKFKGTGAGSGCSGTVIMDRM